MKTPKTKWHYIGDGFVDADGMWISLDGWDYGYATAIRVTPCSDVGGPYNEYWIDRLCVSLPEEGGKKWDDMVRSCGADEELDDTEEPCLDGEERQLFIVECCVSYGYYDVEWSHVLRIGKESDCSAGWDRLEPDITVRGSSSHDTTIRRLAKKQWLY
jgi:hypothetical protein